jgi:hypothetical protein
MQINQLKNTNIQKEELINEKYVEVNNLMEKLKNFEIKINDEINE